MYSINNLFIIYKQSNTLKYVLNMILKIIVTINNDMYV